jgi:hypothetical protein
MNTNSTKIVIPAWHGGNQMARSLFHRAGTAAVAVAVDTRPKKIRNRKAYTRKGRGAQRGFE